jgi:hypothetical protein
MIDPIQELGTLITSLNNIGNSTLNKALSGLSGTGGSSGGSSNKQGTATTNNGFSKSTIIGGKAVVVHYDKDGKMDSTKTINAYENGTKGTDNEWAYYNEKGLETIITPKGEMGMFNKGTNIIPADGTKNLWDWSSFNPSDVLPKFDFKVPQFNFPTTKSGDANYNFNGDFNIIDPTDGKALLNDVIKQATSMAQLTKNNN